MSATTGSFSIGNSTVQMPVKTGTLGPSVVDIGKLYAQSGMFTYDPGSRVNLAFLKFVFRKDRKQARRFAPRCSVYVIEARHAVKLTNGWTRRRAISAIPAPLDRCRFGFSCRETLTRDERATP